MNQKVAHIYIIKLYLISPNDHDMFYYWQELCSSFFFQQKMNYFSLLKNGFKKNSHHQQWTRLHFRFLK